MAVTKLAILNPADKTRHFTVATGEGAPANTDSIATDVKTFPVGSQYTDTSNKKFYIRMAATGVAADWTNINA